MLMSIAEIESKGRFVRISFNFTIDQTKMDVLDLYADTPSHRYDTEGAIIYQTCYGFWKYSCTGKWYFADIGSTY